MSFLSVVKSRRAALKSHFDVVRQFEAIEESCVPSYVHPNLFAAMVAWARLAAAAALYRRFAPAGPVLDFGAATGEVYHVLRPSGSVDYHFIENDELLARTLTADITQAVRETSVEPGRYAAIFALDSLEHNDDYADLLGKLADGLRPDGLLILSGTTESWLYRLGRRIAGHYHKTTIFHIERAAEVRLVGKAVRTLPSPLFALFRISVWANRPKTS